MPEEPDKEGDCSEVKGEREREVLWQIGNFFGGVSCVAAVGVGEGLLGVFRRGVAGGVVCLVSDEGGVVDAFW